MQPISPLAAFLLLTLTLLSGSSSAVAEPLAASASPQPALLGKEDEQAIRKTVLAFEEVWNAHDMKRLAPLFRPDAEFINVVGMHWRGRDAIVAAHAAFHATMFKDCRLKTDSIEIRPLGDSVAIAVVVTTQDSFTTPSGQVMPKTQTKQSYVLAKGADGWQIAHAQNVRVDAEAAKNDPVNK